MDLRLGSTSLTTGRGDTEKDMNIVEIKDLTKAVTEDKKLFEILNRVTFGIEKESFTTLIGPSGCGKSTLLRILAGLIPATSGTITWEENKKPTIAFVFQTFALFPHLTIEQNVEFGLKMQGVTKNKREKTVKDLLEEVGLVGTEKKYPNELSGGMRQRVGIARALAIEPDLLLMDEPFSALDEFTAENLRKLLLKIWKDRKITILMVTHLISEAIEMSDQIIAMTPRPGTVEEVMENKLDRPRNKRSHEFFTMEDKLQSILKV